MTYSVFNKTANNQLIEPMFLGNSVNVARYDQQKYKFLEDLVEKQMSFFWRAEEVDITKDRLDWTTLSDNEKHIFVSNLKYQTLLDSVQTRSPTVVLLPLVSLPELESWISIWSFFELIHSRSYTHIIRNLFTEPGEIFDDIMVNPAILKRASDVAKYWDELYEYSLTENPDTLELKKRIYMCLLAVYALEGIRFFISFICSWSFGERKLMEGNAKIIKLICRDELTHMNAAGSIINTLEKDDPDFAIVKEACHVMVYDLFHNVVEQEKEWSSYLFKDGSMIGLNKNIADSYLEYITNQRMKAIGLEPMYPVTTNPVPWVDNWIESDHIQVAPQEVELTSYLVGQIDASLEPDEFADFEL